MAKIATSVLIDKIYAFCEAYSGIQFFPYQAQFAKRIIRSVIENDGDEITALFSRQCLEKNQRVLMATGQYVPIQHVKTGDIVMGFDYDRLVECEVTSAYCAGKQRVYKVTFTNGVKITCSANHRLLDYKKKLYRPLTDFEADDLICYYLRDSRKIVYTSICSIKDVGEKETYDLEVAGVESYVAEGLLVHNSGKSETVATISGGLAIILPTLANLPMFAGDKRLEGFVDGILIGIFAPVMMQAQTTFGRIKQRLNSKHAQIILSDPDLQIGYDTNNGQNLVLTNGSLITCMSASEGSSIESKSYMLILVDEAQDVSNFKYSKSISPMGAFYNATKILIGTPTIQKGFFNQSITRNKREYNNGIGRRNHFEYNYEVVMKYNPKYAKYIAGEKRRLGEESDEFQMSYNLKWILERGMFIDPAKFDRILLPKVGISLEDRRRKHVVGIDCGKASASTVVTVLEVDFDNPVIIEASKDINVPDYIGYDKTAKAWLEMQGDNWEEQYYQIIDFLKNFRISKIVIDATGAGSPLADRLAANLDVEVIPFVFSQSSKSDLYKNFDAEIKAGRFHVPADEVTVETREFRRFSEQMLDLTKTYSGQFMVCQKPSERGAFDDYCFTGGTKILVIRDGSYKLTNIKDVKLGDLVLTHNNRWKPVSYLHRRMSNKAVEVSCWYFGSSKATENHPYLTERGFVSAGNLTLNDKLLYAIDNEEIALSDFDMIEYFHTRKSSNIVKNNLTDIELIGDKIRYKNPRAKLHNRFVKADANLFKLCGYYLAEGSCGSHNVQFTFNSNETDFHNEVKELLSIVFGIESCSIGFKHSANNATTVYTSSKPIREFFRKHFSGTSSQRTIPMWIMKAQKNLQVEFLKGYWNGDGSASLNSGVVFTTTSSTLAYQIRDMLLRFDVISGMNISKREGKLVRISSRPVRYNHDLYGVRIVHPTSFNKLSELLDLKLTKCISKFSRPEHAYIENGFLHLSIRKLESVRKICKVYNLEVECDHTYTVLNSTVHNCDSSALACWGAKEEGIDKPVMENNPLIQTKAENRSYFVARNNITARRR